MKPLAKIVVFLPLAALLLSGCEDTKDTSLEGTWQATKLVCTDAVGARTAGPLPSTWVEMLLLKPDGTFSYSSTQAGKTVTGTGLWGHTETELVLAGKQERRTDYRIDGDELVLSGNIPEGPYSLYWSKIAGAK